MEPTIHHFFGRSWIGTGALKTISSEQITSTVRELCIRTASQLPADVKAALESARRVEESETGKAVLDQLIENASIAAAENVPICQDTGLAVLFVELGQDIHIEGDLMESIQEGVRRGYADGYLRKSVVRSPIDRVNTKDNTPAVIHLSIVPGDILRITMLAKGGGAENMSGVCMLKPSDGVEGVKKYIVEKVEAALANPCPPIVVGVGIGGTMEKAALMAKHSLLRSIGSENSDPALDALEKELLIRINNTGIGPAGFGGCVTALAVFIESHPCHIASLPVAVNLECHAHRHASAEL